MEGVQRVLEAQRKLEHEFVVNAMRSETQPKGWPAALLMFHVSMWRERLRDALKEFRQAGPYTAPPENTDEVNDAELASGIGTPLADAAARSDKLLTELIALSDELGDRPFKWFTANTTGEALLRNSYLHPRNHIAEYLKENGDQAAAQRLVEDGASEMRAIAAPPHILGATLYNLAAARAAQGRLDDALLLLGEAMQMRPDARQLAAADADFASLRDNARFKALVRASGEKDGTT
ncbi:MAG: TPR end-of-group domain-containing protein [Candidatus Dormibacteraceae bacterium]